MTTARRVQRTARRVARTAGDVAAAQAGPRVLAQRLARRSLTRLVFRALRSTR